MELRRTEVLARRLEPPLDLALREACLEGFLDVEGDLEAVLEVLERHTKHLRPRHWIGLLREVRRLRAGLRDLGIAARLAAAPIPNPATVRRSGTTTTFPTPSTGSGWAGAGATPAPTFPRATRSWAPPQEKKLGNIARKLRLVPGERLLNIGAGWGGLVLFAAAWYGVHAVGVAVAE